MKWILFWVWLGQSPSPVAIFETKVTCEAARDALRAVAQVSEYSRAVYVCVYGHLR